MEIGDNIKTVVFGVGGAGCRTADMLSGINAQGRLVGIDLGGKTLLTLGDDITKIELGGSLDDVTDVEAAKTELQRDLGDVDGILEGADMAIIIAGLGRKTGTYISSYLAKKATDKGVLCISIVIYPFSNNGGKNFKVIEAEEALKTLRGVSNGLIVLDNRIGRKNRSTPMVQVFKSVNSWILRVVDGLLNSAVGFGPMSMQTDDLRFFFHDDVVFVMGVAEDSDAKGAIQGAFEGISAYVDKDEIEKALVMMESPYEMGIVELRDLTEEVPGLSEIEELRWVINTNDAGFRAAVLAGVKGTPFLDEARSEDEEGDWLGGAESEEAIENSLMNMAPMTEVTMPEPEKQPSMGSSDMPQALIGMNLLELPGAGEEEDEGDEEEADDTEGDAKQTLTKRKAVRKRIKRQVRRKAKEEAEAEEEEDIEDIAAELTGFPMYKRKGQKRLSEYSDEFGIEYI